MNIWAHNFEMFRNEERKLLGDSQKFFIEGLLQGSESGQRRLQ